MQRLLQLLFFVDIVTDIDYFNDPQSACIKTMKHSAVRKCSCRSM